MTERRLKFTPAEMTAVEEFEEAIATTRFQRSARVAACMEALEAVDEEHRLIALVCIQYYLSKAQPGEALTDPEPRHRAYWRAPGLCMAYGELGDLICQTGEFVPMSLLCDAAETLGFKREKGWKATEFLYQWIAVQHPGSEAEGDVRYYGLRSGGMAHDINNGRCFNTEIVLFHHTAMGRYLESIEVGTSPRRTDIDPIICLAATDDWERAVSLAPTRKQHQLAR